MPVYPLVLFVHVLSAMGMIAAVSLLTLGEVSARRAQSPTELRSINEKELRVASVLKALVPVLAASGLYMAWAAWSMRSPWVIAAFLVVVYLTASGPLVFGRRMQKAVDIATAAGAITPESRSVLEDPVFTTFKHVRVALIVLLVFLMTVKPGLAGTLGATAFAIALGAVTARMRSGARIEAAGPSMAAPEP